MIFFVAIISCLYPCLYLDALFFGERMIPLVQKLWLVLNLYISVMYPRMPCANEHSIPNNFQSTFRTRKSLAIDLYAYLDTK